MIRFPLRHFAKPKSKLKQWVDVRIDRNVEKQMRDSSHQSQPGGIKDMFKKPKLSNLYRPFLEQLYSDQEIKSQEMDLQQSMQQLSQKHIDYNKVYQFMMQQQQGEFDEETENEMQREREIVEEKMKEAAKTKQYINFFNKGTTRLMEKTPNDVLCELGLRAFAGSRDVPKDDEKAVGLF